MLAMLCIACWALNKTREARRLIIKCTTILFKSIFLLAGEQGTETLFY